MKKCLFMLLSVAAILSFASCGSTPTVEPQKKPESVQTEEPTQAEEESAAVVEESSPEDFSKENETLLSKADAARQRAIDAGAEKYFPDVLASDDKFYDEVKAEVSAAPTANHSEQINEVIVRYDALATACMAKELKEKADELGLSDASAEKALSDFEISDNGSDMRTNAEKALNAYSALLLQHLGAMAKTERKAALEAKKNADSVKAGVAKKAEYTEASNTFKKADADFVTKNLEGAYKGYRTAKNTFTNLYETIAEKRAAAQAAIERAKQRVAEAETYTIEADSIAPLQGEVAGIEKEDAVLLEADNFANPDDAIINVEESEDAKNAAAIDDAIDSAADEPKGETK